MDLTVQVNKEVNQFLASKISMLEVLATSPALDSGDFPRFDQQARGLLYNEGVGIILRDTQGRERVNTTLPLDSALDDTSPDVVAIVDEIQSPYVSDLVSKNNKHYISLSVPVWRQNQLRYIMNAEIQASVFAEILRRAANQEAFFSSITDRTGRIIARSTNSSAAVGKFLASFVEKPGEQGEWTGTNSLGVLVHGAYRRTPYSGWLVSAGIEQAVLNSPFRRSLILLATLGLFLIAVAVAVSIPILRRMSATQKLALRTAESLAESELRHRTLADALPQLVWTMDAATGMATYRNEKFRSYYGPIGPEREERVGRNHPEDSDRMAAAWQAAVAAERPYEVEGRLRREDGAYRWHKLVLTPVHRDETMLEWLGTALDIDEIVTARQRLEDTTDLLRLAQDAAGAGVWEWDMRLNVVRMSSASARMLNIAPDSEAATAEMTVAQWKTYVCPEDRPAVRADIKRAIALRTTYSSEFRIVVPGSEQTQRWVQSFGRFVFDEAGIPVRCVGLDLDITARKASEQRIAHMACHDVLTELPNRALFRASLEQRLAEVRRSGSLAAVLCLDLDRFKTVNDTLGHHAGDTLLRKVAQRLKVAVRESDLVARLGGDEFAMILANLEDSAQVRVIAERIIQGIGQPIDIDGHLATVGISIGIALIPTDGLEADTLLRHADLALYRAKAAERNTFRFYEASMDAAVESRSRLEFDMREAVMCNSFSLQYQPVLCLANNAIVGCEALLRWQHPVRGLIAPAEFIPLAEETGLIVPLGEWALREACREAASWPDNLRVAVNVSAIQFQQPGLEQNVVRALALTNLAPNRLELEVTESILVQDAEAVIACLHRLRAFGVRIALDDFGTGYSSLSYLRRFPFDKIKIDRSFVSEIGDPDAAAIVRAVVGLATHLGASVTAEGVETDAQLDRIRREGCSEVQGYLVSRPLPADHALRFIRGRKARFAA
ncbi:MAG TPA: EAL domain-containing protein [Methylobacterium sp.]